MEILLTEDEIEALSVWWLDAPEAVDWAETLNRAQIKKVVEEFETDVIYIKELVLNGQKDEAVAYLVKCWQALKKEAGL